MKRDLQTFLEKRKHINVEDTGEKSLVYSLEKDETVTANVYLVTEQVERPVMVNIEHLKEQRAELEARLADLNNLINRVEQLEQAKT